MQEVAATAGVARATVYRYFPSRQALLDEVVRRALADTAEQLNAARVDEVALTEGLARAVRALTSVGDAFVVLVREREGATARLFERRVALTLRRLFEGGQARGEIRDDIPSAWLAESLIGLVVSVLTSSATFDREDTIAAITSLFLDGARRPDRAKSRPPARSIARRKP